MRNRRGADRKNVVVEMVKYGSPELHQKLLEYFNEILSIGQIPENWHSTIFTMLPETGNHDQFGFRRNKTIDDVFVILESIIGKTNEWDLLVWMISLDLRKAFDKIKFAPLFAALREQDMPELYIHLLSALYEIRKDVLMVVICLQYNVV